MGDEEEGNAFTILSGMVVGVTGFQLIKETYKNFWTGECLRCDGTGRLTCTKCRGFGYLRKSPAAAADDDVSNIYLCPFCGSQGLGTCNKCKGKGSKWLDVPNFERFFQWAPPHLNQHVRKQLKVDEKPSRIGIEKRKKTNEQQKSGGFSISGNAE